MKEFYSAVCCLLFTIILNNIPAYGETHLNCCGLNMPVVFEDQALPTDVKDTILDDFQLIYGHLSAEGRWTVRKPREVDVNDRKFKVTEGIILKGGYKITPDKYQNEFMLVGVEETTQMEYIFVSKKLSDGYREALGLKAANEEAFQKLDEFIDFMNNIDEATLPESLDKLLYLPGEAQKFNGPFDEDHSAEYRDGYGRYEYRKNSLLEFGIDEEYCGGNLIANIIMITKNSDPPKANEQLVVYHNGRWKFVNIWLLE